MRGADKRLLACELSCDEAADADIIRSIASDLLASIEGKCPQSRSRSLAITKLEECVMWAVRAISTGGCDGTV